jgi:hypothetical protein
VSKKPQKTHIQFGFGLKLVSEDWFVHEMGGVMQVTGFRALCRNLGVPMIGLGDDYYVDFVRFQLAMSAIMRIGEPDFYAPGARKLRDVVGLQASTRDPKELLKNYETIARELLLSKKLEGVELTSRVRKDIKAAAKRMAHASLQLLPVQEQRRYTERAMREFTDAPPTT